MTVVERQLTRATVDQASCAVFKAPFIELFLNIEIDRYGPVYWCNENKICVLSGSETEQISIGREGGPRS